MIDIPEALIYYIYELSEQSQKTVNIKLGFDSPETELDDLSNCFSNYIFPEYPVLHYDEPLPATQWTCTVSLVLPIRAARPRRLSGLKPDLNLNPLFIFYIGSSQPGNSAPQALSMQSVAPSLAQGSYCFSWRRKP